MSIISDIAVSKYIKTMEATLIESAVKLPQLNILNALLKNLKRIGETCKPNKPSGASLL